MRIFFPPITVVAPLINRTCFQVIGNGARSDTDSCDDLTNGESHASSLSSSFAASWFARSIARGEKALTGYKKRRVRSIGRDTVASLSFTESRAEKNARFVPSDPIVPLVPPRSLNQANASAIISLAVSS